MTMMLVEAYKKGIIKVGDYINYNPDYRECILAETETGWHKEEIVKTEDLKYQFAGIIFGQVLLLADGGTEPIWLKGKIGHKNGPKAIQRYTQECFSCEDLGAIGICLIKPMFKELPEILKNRKFKYWLVSPCIEIGALYIYFGVCYVDNGNINYCCIYCETGSTDRSRYGVRPAVILPSDIKIDENNNLVYEEK